MQKDFNYDEDHLLIKKTKRGLRQFATISIGFYVTILLLRIFEYIIIVKGHQSPVNALQVLVYAFYLDLLFFLKASFYLFIPFILAIHLTIGERKTQTYTYGALCTIVIIVWLLLTKYLYSTLVPLGADLFGYSISEIMQTAMAGASLDIVSIISFFLIIGVFWVGILFLSDKNWVPLKASLVFIALLVIVFLSGISTIPSPVKFKSDFDYNLAINKQAYFIETSYNYFTEDEPEIDIYAENYLEDAIPTGTNKASATKASATLPVYNYVDSKYPFLRENNTPDVLGNFFNKFDTIPNIVYIQVEGLGRAFSGDGAYLGSFTPFLDTLANKSIYFENFLASQGRTFASLPSVLGSLPFAEHGFSDLGVNMPKHLTLINILKSNGYRTQFFSGFDLKFDNEGLFLKKSNIDAMIAIDNYGSQFKKMPSNSGGFTWGYGDMEVMTKFISFTNSMPSKPTLNIIQTVSMHTPYQVLNQEKYLAYFEQYMTLLGFDEIKKESYRKYKNVYSTILYTDNSLKMLFQQYAKRADFKNTIFIISGDHRLPEIPISTKIDRYHVPLIIYSPKLNKSARIKSISTHFDITPSFLAFLHKNYNVKVPKLVNFIGSGLDTVRSFRNIHKYPLMQTKNDLNTFVSGEYFLDQNILFSISSNMNVEPLENQNIMSQLKSELNQFKAKNDNVSKVKTLLPDSIYNRF